MKRMIRKAVLVMYLLSLLLVLGCQEKQKPASLIKILKQKQAQELAEQLTATSDWDGYSRMVLDIRPRDIVIARNPGIEQVLYLTVVDKEGKPIECSHEPMRIMVDNDGKLLLKCSRYGKFKPVAVEGDKVVVEQI